MILQPFLQRSSDDCPESGAENQGTQAGEAVENRLKESDIIGGPGAPADR